MPEPIKAASLAELTPGARKLLDIDGRAVALFRVGDRFYAIDDVCTHDGGPLAEGDLDGPEIECPRHGARFDVQTGKALSLPATEPVASHRVEVRGDDVYIHIQDDATPDGAHPPSRSPSMIDDEALLDALRTVKDPELNVNILDLGLVYSVQTEDDAVYVEMTLTSPACPVGPEILRNAVAALEKVEGVAKAKVRLVMSPPWTPDLMTDAARDELGVY